MGKEKIKKREQELLELTGAFCTQKLDEDYLELCNVPEDRDFCFV
jgi:hypothetical protein